MPEFFVVGLIFILGLILTRMMHMGGMMPPGPGIPPLMPGMPPGRSGVTNPYCGESYFFLAFVSSLIAIAIKIMGTELHLYAVIEHLVLWEFKIVCNNVLKPFA